MGSWDQIFVGGQWQTTRTDARITVQSPYDHSAVGHVVDCGPEEIDRAVRAAHDAFATGPWARMSPTERAGHLLRFAEVYERRVAEITELQCRSMGGPISYWKMVDFMPSVILRYYAALAEQFEFEHSIDGPAGRTVVRRLPVGVVGAIVPWNGPQFLSFAKLAPAWRAGCTAVLKPAPECPLDLHLLGECALEAELPAGVLNVVTAGREASETLVTHPLVKKIAFTGSTAAGRRIGALCGERIKRVSLELGGKSAALILDDADLPSTMGMLKFASFGNNGEVCAAQTRILAPRARYEEVVEALCELAGSLKLGDPLDPATEIGPLVAKRQRARVEEYIAIAQQDGAKVASGGGRPSSQSTGWFIEPTILRDVDNGSRVAQEEIFGPVLTVTAYDSEAEGIRLANESDYGLAGSVWTSDPQHGFEIANQIEVGVFGINGLGVDPTAPFGGMKCSGLGRELGEDGLRSYQEAQSVALPPGI